MQYLLDKSICVYFLRGKLELDQKFKCLGIENFFISEITVFELKFGAENSLNKKRSHESVDRFVGGLSIIPIFGCLKHYSETKVKLRKNGTPLHDEFDLLIGSTALTHNLTLITDNVKDFKNIVGLKIENWISQN
jgi:tRNA(fMet)-specific endonuclease VapC